MKVTDLVVDKEYVYSDGEQIDKGIFVESYDRSHGAMEYVFKFDYGCEYFHGSEVEEYIHSMDECIHISILEKEGFVCELGLKFHNGMGLYTNSRIAWISKENKAKMNVHFKEVIESMERKGFVIMNKRILENL